MGHEEAHCVALGRAAVPLGYSLAYAPDEGHHSWDGGATTIACFGAPVRAVANIGT